jgi:peptide/nickel transport system substrate-binding protein
VRTWRNRRASARGAARPFAGALLAVGIALALGACGGSSSSGGDTSGSATVDTAPAATGGTLRLARSIEPVTLNPFTCSCDNGSWQTMAQIYDTLVEFMPGAPDDKPGLATSWEASNGQRTFTFHLRPAKFSDGRDVTAEDVKYSLDRANSPDSTFYSLYAVIKDVRVQDASTVVVNLREPTPSFPAYVGFPATSIVPKAVIERMGDDAFGQHPIGSGAFKLQRWAKGQEVDLVRNPNYWRRGQPYLDEVKMLYVPNDNTRVLDLLSGDVDAVDAVPFSQTEQIDSSGQARVLFQDSSAMYNVWLNERYKPLDEIGVRQALNYATPKEQIVQAVFHGKVDVANANLPKLKFWSGSVKPYPYDLEKARELMARSSMPDGFPIAISIVSGDNTTKQVVQVLQDAWSKIGVKVTVQQYDEGTVSERRANYQYQGYMPLIDVFTSDLSVPDEFAQLLFATPDAEPFNGRTFWRDAQTTRLVGDAIHATDAAQQAELWRQVQQRTMDNPSTVPLVFPKYRAASRNGVRGFQYVLVGWWRLEQVSLER